MTSAGPEWVPLVEGARILTRLLAGVQSDSVPRTVLREAVGLFTAAAREGAIDGEGWRDAAIERTPLSKEDWVSHRIDFDRNRLEPQIPTMRRIHLDRITDVVVDARDVRTIASTHKRTTSEKQISEPREGTRWRSTAPASSDEKRKIPATTKRNDAKARAVAQAVEAIWPGGVPDHLPGKDRNKRIIEWCTQEGISGLSPRTINRALSAQTSRAK